MTAQQRLLRTAGLLAAGVLLFLFFAYLLIPTGRIDAVISQLLAEQGFTLTPGARKTILPGLAWDNLQLSSEQGALLRSEQLKVQLRLLPLLAGKAKLGARAAIGAGRFDLEYGLTGKDVLDLHIESVSLADIPFFKTVLGAQAGGSLWSQGTITRGPKGVNGELKLEVKQLEFSGVKLGGFPLPDAVNLRSQGMIRVTNNIARLESFTLQGDEVHMRISGNLPSGANAATAPLKLTLEIMPKAEFMEKQKLVFLLLAKFMVSPGVYRLPISGTLLKPVIL